jgi:hypothetical protein
MAVDVPDTFVGRTKTPPRYPPPKPSHPSAVVANNITSVPVNNNSPGLRKKVVTAQANQVASNGMMKPAPPSRDHLRMEEDGRAFVINHAAPLPSAQVGYCIPFLFHLPSLFFLPANSTMRTQLQLHSILIFNYSFPFIPNFFRIQHDSKESLLNRINNRQPFRRNLWALK